VFFGFQTTIKRGVLMPTYDNVCEKCGNIFETFQAMSEKPIDKCPLCGGKSKRKIGAGLSPIFKGSGFYCTDYKNKDNKKHIPKQNSDVMQDKPSQKIDNVYNAGGENK
jgi:putative FmdB family regulatory protein